MKSYSNDIPNVSTEEIKRSTKIAEDTNKLVKNNLDAIKDLETTLNKSITDLYVIYRSRFRTLTLLSVINLAVLVGWIATQLTTIQ